MDDCKYCGRKSSKYHRANGLPLYCCKRETVQIRYPYDLDGDIENLTGGVACCIHYERQANNENQ